MHKKFLYRPTRDVSLLSGHTLYYFKYVTVLPLLCKHGLVEPDFYETLYRILVPEPSGETRFLQYMKI